MGFGQQGKFLFGCTSLSRWLYLYTEQSVLKKTTGQID